MAIGSGQQDTTANLIPPGSVGPVPAVSPDYITEDMNVTNGGIARGTNVGGVWTDVYNITGSGLFYGALVTLEEQKKWAIRLIIDGNEIYGSDGILTDDLDDKEIYGYNYSNVDDRGFTYHQGLALSEKSVLMQGPLGYPVAFASSIVIKIKKDSGGGKKFRAGLITRSL
jgi:hypothetical protein